MKNENSKNSSVCRLCGSSTLTSVLKLASTPPANAFISKDKLNLKQKKYPLELFFCKSCKHVQLTEIIDPRELFENYVYVSGTSPLFRNHFYNYAKTIIEKYKPSLKSYVLDIGSNDGTLLKYFKEFGYKVIGVDPAIEISMKANKEGIKTINDFFNFDTAKRIDQSFSKASLITANNVFAHCDDLSGITQAISNLLAPNGLFVFEVSYLVDVYEKTLFDTIYHEHLSYHSVIPLVNFFKSKNMELIDVTRVSTHGGSIRCVVKNSIDNLEINDSVKRLVDMEKRLSFDNPSIFKSFKKNIDKRKNELNNLLKEIKSKNKTIAGFGAPAKATTLIYEFGLKNDILDFIVDDSPLKQNLFSPGIHIPIYSSRSIEEFKPDFILILAWNFADSIIKNNRNVKDYGGKFIVPLPNLEVI